jgi:hypothetical protein
MTIKTRPLTPEYAAGWDAIFNKAGGIVAESAANRLADASADRPQESVPALSVDRSCTPPMRVDR